jgi:hypothetical protein
MNLTRNTRKKLLFLENLKVLHIPDRTELCSTMAKGSKSNFCEKFVAILFGVTAFCHMYLQWDIANQRTVCTDKL